MKEATSRWIELTLAKGSRQVLFNVDQINHIGEAPVKGGAWIGTWGGRSFRVKQDYKEIKEVIFSKGIELSCHPPEEDTHEILT